MERETGIEPASLAWKAKVLPLNYSRKAYLMPWHVAQTHQAAEHAATVDQEAFGGEGWIRTSVGVNRQIYSLLPLTTRPPLHGSHALCHDFCQFMRQRAYSFRHFTVFRFEHGDALSQTTLPMPAPAQVRA